MVNELRGILVVLSVLFLNKHIAKQSGEGTNELDERKLSTGLKGNQLRILG